VRLRAPTLRTRWIQNILLGAAVALAATLFWPAERVPAIGRLAGPIQELERLGYDALFALRGPQPSHIEPGIVVLGYDHGTERDLGELWPPSRKVHAAAIRRLKADGARLIVYDVLFTGPTEAGADRELHEALLSAGNVVLTCRIDRDRAFASNVQAKRLDGPYFDEHGEIDFEAASTIGFAEVPQDLDGVVRRMVPALQFQGEWVPSLATAAYLRLRGLDSSAIRLVPGAVFLGDLCVPCTGPTGTDPIDGSPIPSALVDFPAGGAAFPSPATFQQVVRGEFAPGAFRDKIVFVGVTGIDLTKATNDHYVSAYTNLNPEVSGGIAYREVPGVVLQAHMLNALLRERYMSYAPPWLVFALVLCASFAGTTLVRRYANWRGPVLQGAVVLLFMGAAASAFFYWSAHVPYIVPGLLLLGSSGLVAWVERGALKRKWEGYVSPEVLELILREEDGFAAQRYQATVVFGDIRGFMTFSDQHDPERVVRLLNLHFERLTKILHEERGTIDRFLGDGILCVFGVPVPLPDAAVRGVRAAWRMREAAMRPIEEAGRSFALATGFGVTTGAFVAGHVGSKLRHDFTIIGDVVNVAARLQMVTGGADVVIDAPTLAQVREHVDVEPLGAVALKGKPLPVECYRVTAWHEVGRGQAGSGALGSGQADME
jgi:adenylate cyclase